jgi:DNA-binding transcriptional LysR family regulator
MLVAHARAVLGAAEQAKQAAADLVNGAQGVVSIGFVGSAMPSVLTRELPVFRKQCPQIELVLEESTTVQLVGRLQQRSVDIALLRAPLLGHPQLEITVLETHKWMIAIPAEHRLAHRRNVALADLGNEAFIVFSKDKVPSMYAMTQLLFQEAGIAPVIAQEAMHLRTVLGLVECGLGIGLVPSVAQNQFGPAIRLLRIAPTSNLPPIGIAMAYDKVSASSAARRFAQSTIDTMLQKPVRTNRREG